MSLTKIKGQNFRVFEEQSAVVEAQSCQVTITGNMEDATTKDSEGGFTQEQMTEKSWQVQVDHVDASAARIKALLTRMKAMANVAVCFDQTTTTAGTQNRTKANAPFARQGNALLTDLSIQANDRTTITITEQYTGNGALATA